MRINFIFACLFIFFANITYALDAKTLFSVNFETQSRKELPFKNIQDLMNRNKVRIGNNSLELNAIGGVVTIEPVLPAKLPENFTVHIHFKVMERSGDNFFRCNIGALSFLNRNYSLTLLQKPERGIVNSGATHLDKEVRLALYHTKSGVTVYKDGRKLETIPCSDSTDNISFVAYNQKTIISKLEITSGEIDSSEVSINLLPNSSFEKLTNGFPDYWGPPHWGVSYGKYLKNMDLFRKEYCSSEKEALDGKRSFMVVQNSTMPDFSKHFLSTAINLTKDTDYTFSGYVKAASDDAEFTLLARNSADKSVKFKADRTWKRFQIQFKCTKNGWVQVGFYPNALDCPFYLDAFQLEEGAAVSPYLPSLSDSLKKMSTKTFSSMDIPRFEKAPVLDGLLKGEWKNAMVLKMKNAGTNYSGLRNSTTVMMGHDENNLYLAVEAAQKDIGKLKAAVKEKNGPVWNDDCIEFFFKPNPEADTWYRFAVNTIGVTYAARMFGDYAWAGNWQSTVKKYDDKFVIETAIPFATLEMETSVANGMLFNVGRSSTQPPEVSSVFPAQKGFLDQSSWGMAHFNLLPEKNVAVNLNGTETLRLIPEFSYFSAETEMRFKLSGGGKQLYEQPFAYSILKENMQIASGTGIALNKSRSIISLKEKLSPGTYSLVLRLNGKTQVSNEFYVSTTRANEKKCNFFRKTIVTANGKEFFVWGNFLEGDVRGELKFFKEAGFNTIILANRKLYKELLDEAKKENLMVGIYVPFSKKDKTMDSENLAFINSLKNHPALLWFDLYDEASTMGLSNNFVNREFEKFRKEIGYNYILRRNENIYGLMMSADFSHADIASLDYYTIPTAGLQSIAPFLKTLKRLAPDKVHQFYAQSSGNAYNLGREPTPSELYNQAYQCFAQEIFDVIFWANVPLSRDSLPTMDRIRKEREEIIREHYLDGEPLFLRVSNAKPISISARELNGVVTVIAVNISNLPVSAKFNLPDSHIDGSVEVKFEQRSIATQQNSWTDSFGPWERRVFRLRLK